MPTVLRRSALITGLACLPLVLGSCGVLDAARCESGYTRPDFAALRSELVAAKALWKAKGFPNYNYDFSRFAAPVGFPVQRIQVIGGKVSRVDLADGSGSLDMEQGKTVEGLFTDIETAIARQEGGTCALLSAAYDPRDGHPTQFGSGIATRGVADGFGTWAVSRFAQLVD